MGTFANSEYPDEMTHTIAFYQDLHGLLKQNRSSEKEIIFFGNYSPRTLNTYSGPS